MASTGPSLATAAESEGRLVPMLISANHRGREPQMARAFWCMSDPSSRAVTRTQSSPHRCPPQASPSPALARSASP